MIEVADEVRELYPNCIFGAMLVHDLGAEINKEAFELAKRADTDELAAKGAAYERKRFVDAEPVCHYKKYYKKFNKTYPVLLQMESVLLKKRAVPSAGIFVEAMFLAELNDLLLTAGHDMDRLSAPFCVRAGDGEETYLGISGGAQPLRKNDLYLSDRDGVLSSIIGGPDARSRIDGRTKRAMYFTYGVEGVPESMIRRHLQRIEFYLKIYAPQCEIDDVLIVS